MQLPKQKPLGPRPTWTYSRPQQALAATSAWSATHLMACRAEPDLVAVYESQDGSLALLLRHTITPLAEERRLWARGTRRAAAAIIRRLREEELEGRFVVLQWLPLDEVARILRHWTCRYEGDSDRRAQIARVVEGRLADRAFLASVRTRTDGADGWIRGERDEGMASLIPSRTPMRGRMKRRVRRSGQPRIHSASSRPAPGS